ncbi:MAG: FecR domain-containing protein [Prolixibacteraceae bacterium]|jgi:ferric-dicitrate binding protein FerR (iron transport regulator)|nr:FecR domain-containing protein [Prolixibacteraceae bacterium]
MINTNEHEQLIARYLNGELLKDDEAALLCWISENPGNKKLFFEAKDSWDAALKSRAKETEQLLQFYKKQAIKKGAFGLSGWISGAAAAAVLVAGLIMGSLLQGNFRESKSQVESFSVPTGSRSQVTLADGTIVDLNSDSRLELCDDFSARNRTVTLTGEGYFNVKADREHPFTVRTKKFDIRVTGTKFNVSSYPNDQKISATLTEGQVHVSTFNNTSFTLKPGEKISFRQQTMEPFLEQADVESELAWVKGEFIFKEIPFPDLVRRLERWYDVKLIYKGSDFDAMVYNGKFLNQETIWQVLDALALTSPIDYRKINFREFELLYKPKY